MPGNNTIDQEVGQLPDFQGAPVDPWNIDGQGQMPGTSMPAPGPAEFVPVEGSQVTWGGVWKTVDADFNRWFQTSPATGFVTGEKAAEIARASSAYTFKALSSVISEEGGNVKTNLDYLYGHAHLQTKFIQRLVDVLTYRIAQDEVALFELAARPPTDITPQLQALEAKIPTIVEGVARLLIDQSVGATNQVLAQAVRDLQAADNAVFAAIPTIVAQQTPPIVDAALAPVAAAVATLAPTVTALATESATCVQPMCDAFGPRTSLGNLLKSLGPLLDLLAGVVLAGLTEHDLERIAQAFASIASGSLDSFFSSFVEGGATLGGAAGGLVGEVSTVGADVLGVLGVPGF